MGVRLKLNVNRAVVAGKRVVLVDDSVVRGTTSRKIREMVMEAGAAEVHFRIASPPTQWPCFYGVDTPDRDKLLAATMSEEEMRAYIGVDSLKFVSLDGLYRACGEAARRNPRQPQFCDACFSGDYPVRPSDRIGQGFRLKVERVSDAPGRPRRARHRREPGPRLRRRPRPRRLAAPRSSPWRAPSAGSRSSPTRSRPPAARPRRSSRSRSPTRAACSGSASRSTSAGAGSTSSSTAPPTPRRSRPAPHLGDKDFDQSVEVNLRGTERLIVMLRRCSPPPLPAASSTSPTTAPARPSTAPTARPRPAPRRSCAPGPPRRRPHRPRASRVFRPKPMPTAVRGRFFPGEDNSSLTPCAAEADRLLATLDQPAT